MEYPLTRIEVPGLGTDDVARIIALVAEVIGHKEAALRETLRQCEARYRSLVENAPYGVYRSSVDGGFLDVNPALVRMLGYESQAELCGVDMTAEVYRDPHQRARLVERYHNEERIAGVEVEWKRKDGTPITVRLSGRPVRDGRGVLEAFEMIAEDVTERRALEEQLRESQRLEAMGRLAGGIAHDFNNLLTAIIGYCDLALAQCDSGSSIRPDLEEIKGAADRAASLTRRLLAFGRQQVLQPEVLDLNAVVVGVEKILRRVIGEDLELVTALDPSLGTLRADPGQIEQVIMNLAVNARDAMPEGGKLLIETANVNLDSTYLRRRPVVRAGSYVMLAVSDTGVGMDAQTQARMFEPFFTTKERGKGTGLGLATVYGIVKQSEGYVWVYSELGRGTTFKIYLPRVDGPAEPLPTREEPEVARGGTETVLVVEDEAAVRELAARVLRDRGYAVLEASTAEQALRTAEVYREGIHLLLVDVVLPGMGGKELFERIRTTRPAIKALYMSGYTCNAVVRQGVLEPGVFLLEKPFTSNVLIRKVREVL